MFVKAPTDVLDYQWDWSTWLPTDDTIDTVSWTAQSGITIPNIAAPTGLTATPSPTGGTIAAGNNYFKVTTTNNGGETTTSNEATATTTGSTSSVVLNWDADSLATGANIYWGSSAGAENKLIASLTGAPQTYTVTTTAGSTVTPPSSNTAQATTNTATTATVFISGGTAGTAYTITCQITTETGRIAQNTQKLNVVNL